MSTELIGEWLRDYGVEEFDGGCTFTYKDVIDFSLEVSTDESHLVLSSVVGELPARRDPELLCRLLRLNHLGIATRGATLSIDESESNIVLWISLATVTLDPEQFEQSIQVFLDVSERLSLAVR